MIPISRKNLLVTRAEWSQRDELFEDDHDLAHEIFEQTGKRAFDVAGYTVGYTRELGTVANIRTAVGFNATTYRIASELKPFYGNRPVGFSAFLRFRLQGRE